MKSFFVKTDNFLRNCFKKSSISPLLASVISALIGLLFGFILLLIFNPSNAFNGFGLLLTSGFQNFPKLLYGSSILLLNGLAISVAYKCGLFNIGCSGQFTIGALFALMFAHGLDAPWYVCLFMAIIGGALMGGIVGLLKAYFNVNEVISSIMLNYIGLFITNLIFTNMFDLKATNSMGSTISLGTYHEGSIIPHLDTRGYLSLSIVIAFVVAIIVFIVLNKTNLGYELKGVGFNRDATRCAGISKNKNIVLAMVISGAIAGLAGGCQYLSGIFQYKVVDNVLADGFNGISVAFLANTNPLGCILSALFIYSVTMAQATLQVYDYSTEIVTIIIGSVIYLSAFSLIILKILTNRNYRTGIITSQQDKKYKVYLKFKGRYKFNTNNYIDEALSGCTYDLSTKSGEKSALLDLKRINNDKAEIINRDADDSLNYLNSFKETILSEGKIIVIGDRLYLPKEDQALYNNMTFDNEDIKTKKLDSFIKSTKIAVKKYSKNNINSIKSEYKKSQELDSFYETSKIMFINTTYHADADAILDKRDREVEAVEFNREKSNLYISSILSKVKKEGAFTVDINKIYLPDEEKNSLTKTTFTTEDIKSKTIKTFMSNIIKSTNNYAKNLKAEMKNNSKEQVDSITKDYKHNLSESLQKLERGEAL